MTDKASYLGLTSQTLMIDPSLINLTVAFKEVGSNLQAPHCVRQNTCLGIMRKSKLLEINLGSGYDAYCILKCYWNISNAASLLRGMNDSGLYVSAFYTLNVFYFEGKLCGRYCIRRKAVYKLSLL